jgi:hypothetical protein
MNGAEAEAEEDTIIMPANRNRGLNFTENEVTNMLDLIEDKQPIGSNEWEEIERLHAANFPDKNRTKDTIKRKFQLLALKEVPTGDPNIPTNVRRAKEIYSNIKRRTNLGEDGNEEDEASLSSASDDDNEVDDAFEENIIASAGETAVTFAVASANTTVTMGTVAAARTRRDSFDVPMQRIGSKKQKIQEETAMDSYMNNIIMQNDQDDKRRRASEDRKREAEERRYEEERKVRKDERRLYEERREEERRLREERREEERRLREERREEERRLRKERREEDRTMQMQQTHMMNMMMLGLISSNPNRQSQLMLMMNMIMMGLISPNPNRQSQLMLMMNMMMMMGLISFNPNRQSQLMQEQLMQSPTTGMTGRIYTMSPSRGNPPHDIPSLLQEKKVDKDSDST